VKSVVFDNDLPEKEKESCSIGPTGWNSLAQANGLGLELFPKCGLKGCDNDGVLVPTLISPLQG